MSLKYIVVSVVTVLAMLAFALVWYTADSYQQQVYKDHRKSVQSLLKLKTSELTQALISRQQNYVKRLQNEPAFHLALANGDIEAVKVRLQQGLNEQFSNRGRIHFRSILLRDSEGNKVTGVYEKGLPAYNGCPVIIDQIMTGSSENKHNTKFSLCSHENQLMSEVLISSVSPDNIAYIHVIAYLNDEFMSFDNEIKLPAIIQDGRNFILYQSQNWQAAKQSKHFSRPVLYTLFGDDNVPGLVVLAIFDQTLLDQRLRSSRLKIYFVALVSIIITSTIILTLLFYFYKAVARARKSVGKILDDHFIPVHSDGLPVEFREFVLAYNKIILELEGTSNKHIIAQKSLQAESDFIAKTLHSITNAVLVIDADLLIKLVNPAAQKILGERQENLQGYNLAQIIILYTNRSLSHIADWQQLLNHSKHLNTFFYQTKGAVKELEMMVSPVLDAGSEDVGFVVILKDVTEDRLLRRKLNYESRHDKLTGLLNRKAFESKFDEIISETYRSSHRHIFAYINIDNFKVINQSCSNDAGDLLLKQVSQVLCRNVRKSDLLARLGGDEFALILTYAELENAADTVSDILASICKTGFSWAQLEYPVTASAALIAFSEIDDDFSQLFSKLTTACALAKQKGGNQYYLVGDNDDKVQQHHSSLVWVSRINKAFIENRFKLYVQPIVPVNKIIDKQIYEVLIRYQADDGKIIKPAEFLSAAERFNLIEKIDRWVVAEVIHWMVKNLQPDDNIQISINLSARSISSSSFQRFLYLILQTDLVSANNFCFEVTEKSIIEDVEKSTEFIKQISSLGAQFSLDDFGSGLSSLNHLQQFPLDYLKIDGLFIEDILQHDVSSVFVTAIATVGHSLGMNIIAESVDSTDMLEKLSEAGVDYLQGSAISEPVPIASIDFKQ